MGERMKLLLVEDDEEAADYLKRALIVLDQEQFHARSSFRPSAAAGF